MAAITDLTWQQISDELPPGAIQISPTGLPPGEAGSTEVVINIGQLIAAPTNDITDVGVVKALALLLDAALNAQANANAGQLSGERLIAFPAVTVGNITNGYVSMTRSVVARHQLITATNIIGQSG